MRGRLHARAALSLLLVLGMVACTQAPVKPEAGPSPVGPVALIIAPSPPPEDLQLDLGVRVFDSRSANRLGVPVNEGTFARIRELETHYLPVVLRNTLVESNQWGVVRVLPQDDPSVDLLIEGTIIDSDGAHLTLEVRAVDSSGRQWLDDTYTGRAHAIHYPDVLPGDQGQANEAMKDPFQDLHSQIANDLLLAKMSLTPQALRELRRISAMKHARDLSPEAFGGMLATDAQGYLELERLPADNDPMLARIQAMLERHHTFIDTVDSYYEALYLDVKTLYDLWRHYSNDQITSAEQARQTTRNSAYGNDSFGALRSAYNRYKWAKIFEQEFVGLASGFVSETAPAILELSERVHGLTGSVEEQYEQWRTLLRAIYEIETGGVLP
ncbi:MAG: hypothetical protein JJT88_11750 [Gammaproteobacteria bacterium]|nr:hypothetical protein [Gammaproteobacteria bacterium]